MDFNDEITFIFINGVFKRDCKSLEIMMEERMHISSEPELNNESKIETYSVVPKYFTSLELWQITNLHCWYCDRVVNTKPIFIPKTIDLTDNGITQIGVEGNFCSFNCAYSHLLNFSISSNAGTKDNKYHMLKYLYKVFNGYLPKNITPSPNKFSQNIYSGGDMSRQDFYTKIDELVSLDNNKKNIA